MRAHLVVTETIKAGIGVLAMTTMGDWRVAQERRAFEAARTFTPMTGAPITALLAKTEAFAEDGRYELFETWSHLDATAKHADWLGEESPFVQKIAPPAG